MKRGRPIQNKEILQQRFLDVFNRVKILMEDGYAKYEALKKIGVARAWFYRHITTDQLRELDEIYFSFSGGHGYKMTQKKKIVCHDDAIKPPKNFLTLLKNAYDL